jgi:hypothetical protein
MRPHFKKIIISIPIIGIVIFVFLVANAKTEIQKKYEQASGIKEEYQLKGATLKKVVNSDPKDRFEITVGNDEGQGLVSRMLNIFSGKNIEPKFTPELKISRWDDEATLALMPKMLNGSIIENKNLKFDGNNIEIETPDVDYHLYEIPKSTVNEDGSYEYNIILKKKPANNKVEFSIETKGLDFIFQPPLTKEYKNGYSEEYKRNILVTETQIKDLQGNVLEERPEKIVDSYAVYTSEEKVNWVGGKEYKTGKVGHIFRPKIIDSVGNWTWGVLSIDKKSGILSVEIPQKFLDEAVYPVQQAAGFEFGYVGEGATTVNNVGFDLIKLEAGTATVSGTVNSIYFYAKYNANGGATGYAWQGGLYGVDGEAKPDTLLSPQTATGMVTSTTKAWYHLEFGSTLSVTASTKYYVAAYVNYDATQTYTTYKDSGGDALESCSSNNGDVYNAWPTPLSEYDRTFPNPQNKTSLYATYTPDPTPTPSPTPADTPTPTPTPTNTPTPTPTPTNTPTPTLTPTPAPASWYNTNWLIRKKITITGGTSELNDYQIKIKVYRSRGTDTDNSVFTGINKVNSDYSDLVFTAADGVTPLYHWVEEVGNKTYDSSSNFVWVEVPVAAASPTPTYIYMYYGNSSAASTSDGFNTFVFFDDFDDSSLNTDLWDTYGSYGATTESDGIVTITSGGYPRAIYSKTNYSNAYALRGRVQDPGTTTGAKEFGFFTSAGDINLTKHYTSALRYYVGETYYQGISGNGTNAHMPYYSSGPVHDTNFHIVEVRRYVSGETNYDQFTIDDGSPYAGDYPTNLSRAVHAVINTNTIGNSIVLDWVALRNYAVSEPTVTAWGSLEFVPGASTLNFEDILMQGVNLPNY